MLYWNKRGISVEIKNKQTKKACLKPKTCANTVSAQRWVGQAHFLFRAITIETKIQSETEQNVSEIQQLMLHEKQNRRVLII